MLVPLKALVGVAVVFLHPTHSTLQNIWTRICCLYLALATSCNLPGFITNVEQVIIHLTFNPSHIQVIIMLQKWCYLMNDLMWKFYMAHKYKYILMPLNMHWDIHTGTIAYISWDSAICDLYTLAFLWFEVWKWCIWNHGYEYIAVRCIALISLQNNAWLNHFYVSTSIQFYFYTQCFFRYNIKHPIGGTVHCLPPKYN